MKYRGVRGRWSDFPIRLSKFKMIDKIWQYFLRIVRKDQALATCIDCECYFHRSCHPVTGQLQRCKRCALKKTRRSSTQLLLGAVLGNLTPRLHSHLRLQQMNHCSRLRRPQTSQLQRGVPRLPVPPLRLCLRFTVVAPLPVRRKLYLQPPRRRWS